MKLSRTHRGGLRAVAAAGVFLAALLVSSPPVSAAKAAKHAKKPAFEMPKVRLIATSTPVPFATVRAAKAPVKLGTVSYLLGDYRQSYDIVVSPTRDGGLTWSALQQGQARESGTIPSAPLKRAVKGHLCVIAEKAGARPTGVVATGKRLVLFSRFSPEYCALLVACPNPVPAKPVRTVLFIQGEKQNLTASSDPKGASGAGCHGKPVPWQLGAKAYDTAVRARAKLRKPVAILFARKGSKECKQLDDEVLSACRVQEILGPAVKVRIDPDAGAAEKALAARFRVTVYPSFLVIPAYTNQPKWIIPEGGKAVKGSGAAMPCHFHDTLDAALKAKR